MKRSLFSIALPVSLLSMLCLFSAVGAAELDFVHDIVPILREHCAKCHADQESKGGFSINSRSTLIDGGATPGDVDDSRFIELIRSADPDDQMPPKDLPRVPKKQQELLVSWVRQGLPWNEDFTFAQQTYEPPLLPREVILPPPRDGADHPVDRLLAKYFDQQQNQPTSRVDDATFLRRVSLDLTGLLPSAAAVDAFVNDDQADKRQGVVDDLLADKVAYAEHWLTFWNDWLRNDYAGTGFITGGRKQVSSWLYKSLIDNKPYDQFARELIAPPTTESRGFIDGIKWRGTVSAGQTLEIQFAQSVAQTFLGINMKCASCHDSFIDSWKLSDAYSLAAVYASEPLEIYRCDKPTGETATAAWLFPELGQIDPAAARDQRLKELSQLMTDRQNGRFARTIVNRLWSALMGRGIVHPLDAMHTQPWNEELLDYLANYLVDHDYDLKAVLRLIATSNAYSSRSDFQSDGEETESARYVYAGPRAKRMTSEQYMDAVWQLTGQAPSRFDAPIVRGDLSDLDSSAIELTAKWIWAPPAEDAKTTEDDQLTPDGEPNKDGDPNKDGEKDDKPDKRGKPSKPAKADLPSNVEQLVFRKTIELSAAVRDGTAAVTVDNEFELYIQNRKQAASQEWTQVQSIDLRNLLKAGKNTIVIVARNLRGSPGGLFFQANLTLDNEQQLSIVSDETWEVSHEQPEVKGKGKAELGKLRGPWMPARVQEKHPAYVAVDPQATRILAIGAQAGRWMVRASLLRSDFLMRSLGRPNRDQIITSRPDGVTTLEAIDLSNHEALATIVSGGAQRWAKDFPDASQRMVDQLFLAALARRPTDGERSTILQSLGGSPSVEAIEDLLWAIFVMPEFMVIR